MAKILGDNHISIAAVHQKEIDKDVVPLVIITHESVEENVMNAAKEINMLDIVKEKITIIRIEDMW